ncbi:hypothetical protein N8T08_004416 [Aspergillus melleus]|uniref:Uncharacterized protein n=1 Tax=Aspergillus melleus TaxID=138277 RepID=A0ACC3B5P0_9EURO|nr:hypothetical protein N8T08_004416 [Aspergillus melleus]
MHRIERDQREAMHDLESLSRFTSGRWLWREREQFACRYVKFDLEKLLELTASVTGSEYCIQIVKASEGQYNKVFVLTMNDGREVVAKIPNPNAGRPHFTTASEVATMDFLRNNLGLSVPRVYAWSSRASENAVGAEYIIMEKQAGVTLSNMWGSMKGKQKAQIVLQVVDIEKSLAAIKFRKLGALYYKEDLPARPSSMASLYIDSTGNEVQSSKFGIGPTNHRAFFDFGRADLDIDRGPWDTPGEFMIAIANREIATAKADLRYPLMPEGLFRGPRQYQPNAAKKLSTLEQYLKVASNVLPEHQETHSSVLWHGDLNLQNIFVDPDEPTQILGIIDWQSVSAYPLFMQATRPAFLEYNGPLPEELGKVHLPANFDSLSQDEQHKAKALHQAQTLHNLYLARSRQANPEVFQALQGQNTLRHQVSVIPGLTLMDYEPCLGSLLRDVEKEWTNIVGVKTNGSPVIPCPLQYSAAEAQQQEADANLWAQGVKLMNEFINDTGCFKHWDGRVSEVDYEVSKKQLDEVADQGRMTQLMVDSLGQQSASTALAILESGDDGSFQGPFGLLNMAPREVSYDTGTPSQSNMPSHEFEMDAIWESLDTNSATPRDTHFLAGLYDLVEESQNANPVSALVQLGSTPDDLHIPLAEGLGGLPDEIAFQQSLTTLSPSPSPALQESKHIPPLAPDLLRYFKENVQSLSFPLKNSVKCPWQAIYLPSAMSTFAELTINQTTSHTRLSLFYSLLAASCLHMYARNEFAEDLNISGKRFKDIAAQHLGLAMNKEVLGPGRAKYKEILVATLSMIMLSIFHGENSNAQAFLVDAEYLIRIRGLPKSHKSVKVRSLHHVYTYIHRPSSSLLSIESSPVSLRSFRMVHNSLDGEIDIALEKSNKIGHNDIHLEIMGQWNETLFEDLYEIPESLLALLSQVIRLANEQELLHRGPTVDVRATEELKRRASALEQYILSWAPPFTPLSVTDDESSEDQTIYFKARAMHQALILFYYRRVPNISAWILQDTVRKCLDFLMRSDKACLESAASDKTIIWPGFLAACEALEPDLQSKSLDWLVTAGNRTSLGPFSAAAGIAQCVWKARAEVKDYTLSWFDVMKHERCPIIAT